MIAHSNENARTPVIYKIKNFNIKFIEYINKKLKFLKSSHEI